MSNIRTYVISFILTFAVGGLGAAVTYLGMDSFRTIQKPPLSPPEWLFPVVWTVLFALMAVGAARVYLKSRSGSRRALLLYAAQLAANFLWCVFFFAMGAYLFSFLWLIVLIALVALTAYAFYRTDKLAGLIQIPYLLWLCFAGYLNLAIYIING